MKGFLNNRRISCALSALCFIALGVFLVGWPDVSRVWLCRLLGLALVATGGVYVGLQFVRSKETAAALPYEAVLGVVLAVVGVWLLLTPDLLMALLNYILGVLLLIHAVLDLQGALNLRAGGARRWWAAAILGALTAALGALLLWNPFAGIDALLMLMGLALIYDGVSDLAILVHLSLVFRRARATEPPQAEDEEGGPGQQL